MNAPSSSTALQPVAAGVEDAEIAWILAELGRGPEQRRLPVEAIEAARRRWSDVVPAFLQVIDDVIEGRRKVDDPESPVLVIFHLLAERREHAAYRPLVRLMRLPENVVTWHLGDAVTETAPRVLAAVCDGDPGPLFEGILDQDAGEFERRAMLAALVTAVGEGTLARPAVERFVRDAFANLLPREENYVWAGWLDAVACLGQSDLEPMVRDAFERGYVSTFWLGFENFKDDLSRTLADPDRPWWREDDHFAPFDDTVEELEPWACFSRREDAESHGRDIALLEVNALDDPPAPAVNPLRHVGRNDPCPCGSRLKYKRCCLN